MMEPATDEHLAGSAPGTRLAPADLVIPQWQFAPRVRGFVTTRAGGVSTGPFASLNLAGSDNADIDERRNIAENRRRLRERLPAEPRWLAQVHGNRVISCTSHEPAHEPVHADAAVTRDTEVVLGVLTADCLPVLLADRAGRAVGIAHAGWRGLAAGVVEATIAALGNLGVEPTHVIAWLGPAIGPLAFEVGDDVRDAFGTEDPHVAACFAPHRDSKWRADLYALARLRLARSGVECVHGGGFCTYADVDRFYSYRRERQSGRMAAAIWLSGESG